MRSFLSTASVFLATCLVVGCSSSVDEPMVDESVSSESEALSAARARLVGDYRRADGKNFYETISLQAKGTYSATFKPCGVFDRCATRQETGTWSTGSKFLRLNPKGPLPPKTYALSAVLGNGLGFNITSGGLTERFEKDAVCDPTVFAKVVAPALSDVQGLWTRTEGDLIQTKESLSLRSNFTFALIKVRGPNCKPMQPCPRIATQIWQSQGTFELAAGHGVQLHPLVSVPALAESFGLQRNCEGTLRLETTEVGEDVYLSRATGGCVEDSDCASRQIGPNPLLCTVTSQPAKVCNTETQACEWSCKESPAPFCGGIAGIGCAAGRTCVVEGTHPDAGGTCKLCQIPSCAAPPRNCNYEASPVTPGVCPGCGVLVCGGGGDF